MSDRRVMGLRRRLIKLSSMASCASVTGWAGRGLPRDAQQLHQTLAESGKKADTAKILLLFRPQREIHSNKKKQGNNQFEVIYAASFTLDKLLVGFLLWEEHRVFLLNAVQYKFTQGVEGFTWKWKNIKQQTSCTARPYFQEKNTFHVI